MSGMEYTDRYPIPYSESHLLEIKRPKTDIPPAHYVLKIKSFSQLSEIVKTRNGKYESDDFEADGHKWKLVLYPNGIGKTNGEGHISLYLASTDKEALVKGHLDVLIIFFVYDQIQDKYLTIQDEKIKCYHVLRTENGFDQLLPIAEFNNPSNGYLIDDCCVFGVEVKVIKKTFIGNEVSFIKNPPNGTFTWKIDNFSKCQNEYYNYYSEVFSAGGYKWKLLLYPRGYSSEEKDRSVSLYLHLDVNPRRGLVYVEFNLLVKDQLSGKHVERKGTDWFENSTFSSGFGSFMPLSDLRNASKGFLSKDTLIIEAKITLISASQCLS